MARGSLGRGEEVFWALLQNALDVISLCSADNTFRYVSPSVERVLGYRPEELLGTVISDLLHPEDLEKFGNRTIEEIQTGSGSYGPIEGRYRHKDGSWRHLETTVNILLDDPGEEVLITKELGSTTG